MNYISFNNAIDLENYLRSLDLFEKEIDQIYVPLGKQDTYVMHTDNYIFTIEANKPLTLTFMDGDRLILTFEDKALKIGLNPDENSSSKDKRIHLIEDEGTELVSFCVSSTIYDSQGNADISLNLHLSGHRTLIIEQGEETQRISMEEAGRRDREAHKYEQEEFFLDRYRYAVFKHLIEEVDFEDALYYMRNNKRLLTQIPKKYSPKETATHMINGMSIHP